MESVEPNVVDEEDIVEKVIQEEVVVNVRERYNPKKKLQKRDTDETMTFKDDEKDNDSPLEPVKAPSKWANIYSSTAQSVTDVVARKVEKLQPGNQKKPDSKQKRDFKKGGKQNQ